MLQTVELLIERGADVNKLDVDGESVIMKVLTALATLSSQLSALCSLLSALCSLLSALCSLLSALCSFCSLLFAYCPAPLFAL